MEQEEFKKLIVQVPLKLHTAFKAACAEKKISMKDVITEFIEGFLKEYKKGGDK